MDNAGPIMNKVKAKLFRAYEPETSMVSADDITIFFNNLEQCFSLWGDAFAAVHTSDPSGNDLIDTQLKINKAMAKMRELKINITPKAHDIEC